MTFDQQKAIENYTELARRITVGAYSERSAEDHEQGTYPEDGIEQSIDNLTNLAAQHDLQFCWHEESGTYVLEPMDEEEIAAYKAAMEENELGEDEPYYHEEDEDQDQGPDLHQCPWCYTIVNEEHEEFCRLNPNRNREIVP